MGGAFFALPSCSPPWSKNALGGEQDPKLETPNLFGLVPNKCLVLKAYFRLQSS